MSGLLLKVLLFAALILPVSCSELSCPSKSVVETAVKKIMPVNFEVAGITGVSGVPGLCEVVLTVNKQPVTLYVDKKARYIFSGSIVEIESRKNITLERQRQYRK